MELRAVGRYQILSELARGGMATVYLALDPRFNRQVAVKVFPTQFTHDPMFRARFDREAQVIASLEHQDIVPVYDYGEQDGQPYLVMRYMAGGSLSARIEQGPMSLQDAILVLRSVAAALDYAHRRGIVHRDVKPSNIMFDQGDNAYLSDFGIVKLVEGTTSYTGSGVVGTAAWGDVGAAPAALEEQVVYGFGPERSFTYTLKWGVGYAAAGTFHVRSGEQTAENKFYVQSPNCTP